MLVGAAYKLQAESAIRSASVVISSLSITDKMKILGVVLGSRFTFNTRVKSPIQYAATMRNLHPVLDETMAQKLACSLIIE